jgi:hypothetical protein
MSTEVAGEKTARSLISSYLYERLVNRIIKDEGYDAELAERIMDQALAFLAACAKNHGDPLEPSGLVDVGWHTFILYTKDYAEFCNLVAGRFLHHVPNDETRGYEEKVAEQSPAVAHEVEHDNVRKILARTADAIAEQGFAVDFELWMAEFANCDVNCSQCKNGCSDDPPPSPVTVTAESSTAH